MKKNTRKYLLFHTIIVSLLLVFFFGSLLLLLINIIPLAYMIMGYIKGDNNAS